MKKTLYIEKLEADNSRSRRRRSSGAGQAGCKGVQVEGGGDRVEGGTGAGGKSGQRLSG